MSTDLIVDKANQIASYFAAFPREEAIEGIRGHIQRFWERPMKDQLLDHAGKGGAGLHELVLEAARRMEISA